MFLKKLAILVDSAFFLRRAKTIWGHTLSDPTLLADDLIGYCLDHAKHLCRKSPNFYYEVTKIFVYDCPPISKNLYHPLTQKNIDLSQTETFKGMTAYLDCLKYKRRVALRLGHLLDSGAEYHLKGKVTRKLCRGELKIEDLSLDDFELELQQKGVDMKIGIDIATLALKKQVDAIVLIAGDSDFVPAAKLARVEGVDFILDPMWHPIADNLAVHVDGIMSVCSNPKK